MLNMAMSDMLMSGMIVVKFYTHDSYSLYYIMKNRYGNSRVVIGDSEMMQMALNNPSTKVDTKYIEDAPNWRSDAMIEAIYNNGVLDSTVCITTRECFLRFKVDYIGGTSNGR